MKKLALCLVAGVLASGGEARAEGASWPAPGVPFIRRISHPPVRRATAVPVRRAEPAAPSAPASEPLPAELPPIAALETPPPLSAPSSLAPIPARETPAALPAALQAAPPPAPAAAPLLSAPPQAPGATGSWRDRYTLGAGDIVNLGLYGRPELKREKVPIQPDGTISYLQASGVRAEGLTIDELRAELEGQLAFLYKHPRVLIAPVELRSKKYFVVGKVVENGAYVMERPITLIEAISEARGFESGLVEHRAAELADLSRSFIVRRGQRVPVNMEALFLRGDLSQNILIEPNDYIYVALARSGDVYIFGEVARSGVQAYSPHLTVLAAITARGGFTPRAYRQQVLVVRGSLTNPQKIVVNTNDILTGRAKNFELEGNDIVYVNHRPWEWADDVVNTAIGAFFQAATTTYVSGNVPSLISRPLVPLTNAGSGR